MNGSKGLYISVMAYKHATGNQIDYEDLKEMMESGKVREAYGKYEDYINWFTAKDISGRYGDGNGSNYRNDYVSTVQKVGIFHGFNLDSHSNYKDYKKVVESYPDEISNWFDNVS